ncbi:MAG: hypothetical protein A3A24_03150 [Candidatus Buchananbacteria bacterium RIFCSPLOWO2_01_FULL_46_12]|uniref:Phosphoribosyltransferase domain-containing protein n=2 Tax=Candidatus Buchananiibacteriota TaxID=1817903 RepID=A0A1G1YNU7_9BACT|nr:MAG: hypothetical protein A2744_02650 [Candidatus Buchananbacteria bacterium RIFCSPHIGHO2_01_FULL_44_11]OGY54032.1 MAG: hypothetical protein A3A24_03150 [Candidatus Buchananbacteria bacterium RIFCSPLOWO2_01_FULL_46_12]
MQQVIKFFLDLLFPISCLGCGKTDTWFCQQCFDQIQINRGTDDHVLKLPGFLDQIWAVSDYRQENLTKVLHQFKYRFVVALGEVLGQLLVNFLKPKVEEQKLSFDVVVPVPLAKRRLKKRGFNQSEVMARFLNRNFGWPVRTDLIFRIRHHQPQVGLHAEARRQNVKGIFKTQNNYLIQGKTILLVDDVVTTGSTLSECAKVLKQAGAKFVFGLVVAKADVNDQ